MAANDIKRRNKSSDAQIAEHQSVLLTSDSTLPKSWRRAVEKYAGDADLLAIFAETKKLREAERKKARESRPRRRTG